MFAAKWETWLTASAIVLATGWAIGCELVLPPGFGSQGLRMGLMAAGLVPAAALVVLACQIQRSRCAAVQRHLTALCQMDLDELWQDDSSRLLPSCPDTCRAAPILGQIHEAFREHGRRIQDLEQLRAAGEVRCRRAVAQAEQVKNILQELPEPILVVDGYDEVVLANDSARQVLQLENLDTQTRAARQLVRCQKLVDLLLGTSRRKVSGNRTEEVEIDDCEGGKRWYRVTATRLAGESTETTHDAAANNGAVVVLHDIADQKTLQKRNAEFVSSVSHEMKTPLAGIKAYVELLADGEAEDDATREEFLEVINGQANRLQRLVENMLNLARIEAGVVKVSKQPRSLNELLEEALGVVVPSAEAKKIELGNDLSPMYLGVLADRDMLLQAAINLLSNAIKYTPAGGRVTLRSRMEEGYVRFEVEDTGVGLNEEDCQRVFEKFYRVNKSKDMAAGTGLGLPLAKHIVEDVHGGRLTVSSVLGSGSTFVVTLPCAGQMT